MRRLLATFVALCAFVTAFPAAAQLTLLGAGAGAPGGGSAYVTPFLSVNGPASVNITTTRPADYEGWTVEYSGTPSINDPDGVSPAYFDKYVPGFDATGNAVTYHDVGRVIQRLRLTYPSSTVTGSNPGVRSFSYSSTTAILDDYIYTGTTIPGASIGSTLASPKPTCNVVNPNRQLFGNTAHLEIFCAHRDAQLGREVAAVKFIMADQSGHTATAWVSAMTQSTLSGWKYTPDVFAVDLDISGLTNGDKVCQDEEVYPFRGGASSVNKTADNAATTAISAGTLFREFTTRCHLKATGRASAPWVAYLSGAGNDGTGVWSQTPATAAASPFLTPKGATDAYNNATRGINNATTGLDATVGTNLDAAEIRAPAGNWDLVGSVSSRNQKLACLIFTKDPTVVDGSTVVYRLNAASYRPRMVPSDAYSTEGCIQFKDVKVQRVTSGAFQGETANNLLVQWRNVDFDSGSVNGAYLTNGNGVDWALGFRITNGDATTSILNASTTEHRALMGTTIDTPTHPAAIECYLCIGSEFLHPGVLTSTGGTPTRTQSGTIIAWTVARFPQSTEMINVGNVSDVNQCGFVNLLIEDPRATSTGNTVFKISGDTATGNSSACVVHYVTAVGVFVNGRTNRVYDNTNGQVRTQLLNGWSGNIWPLTQTKADLYEGLNTGGADANPQLHTGDWAEVNSVGHQGEVEMYDGFTGLVGPQSYEEYKGVGSLVTAVGHDINTRSPDPDFTDWQAGSHSGTIAGGTYTVGSGNGTYTVSATSPAACIVTRGKTPHDLAGSARPVTSDTAGAYVSAKVCP